MTRDELVAGAFAIIQRGSPSFRAASQIFDLRTRERAWLLYAWCRHCDDVCDGQVLGHGHGPSGSVAGLQSRTTQALAGETTGILPFDALGQLDRECPLPRRLIADHLHGFAMDEDGWRPESESDLVRYCYHVAGAVGCLMAIVMGVDADDRDTLDRASDLGIAFQLSNIARDIASDAAAGRYYLPAQWLVPYGIAVEAIMDPAHRAALLSVSDRLTALARHYEDKARPGVAALPFRSRVAVLTALRIYGAIGREVARLGPRAWDRRVRISRTRKLAFLAPSLWEAMLPRRASAR